MLIWEATLSGSFFGVFLSVVLVTLKQILKYFVFLMGLMLFFIPIQGLKKTTQFFCKSKY